MNTSDNVHTDIFEKAAETAARQPENPQEATQESGNPIENNLRIEQLENELAATRDQLFRRAADYENLKKRAERERIQLFQSARIDAVKQFLAVNDDLIRTLQAAASMEVQPAIFLEGVQMVASKFQQVLSGYNVQLINEENVPFDVNLHDAMMRQPAPEGVGPDMVIRVLEPGYRMGETVIRHARVIVTQ